MRKNKFEIGDMVRVLVNEDINDCKRYPVGTRRLVLKVRDSPHGCLYDVGIWRYKEDELELVERAPEVKKSKTYEQGLEDSWKLVDRLLKMPYDLRNEIFGVDGHRNSLPDILRIFTAAEILKKLKDWEDSQLSVGDVVEVCVTEYKIDKGIITHISDSRESASILFNDGSVGTLHIKLNDFRKTEQHIDISELLNNIGKES